MVSRRPRPPQLCLQAAPRGGLSFPSPTCAARHCGSGQLSRSAVVNPAPGTEPVCVSQRIMKVCARRVTAVSVLLPDGHTAWDVAHTGTAFCQAQARSDILVCSARTAVGRAPPAHWSRKGRPSFLSQASPSPRLNLKCTDLEQTQGHGSEAVRPDLLWKRVRGRQKHDGTFHQNLTGCSRPEVQAPVLPRSPAPRARPRGSSVGRKARTWARRAGPAVSQGLGVTRTGRSTDARTAGSLR